jgi:hypothetical protein
VDGVDLHHQLVKAGPPVGQFEHVGGVVVHRGPREAPAAPGDRRWGEVEGGHPVASAAQLLGVVTETATDNQGPLPTDRRLPVEPGDEVGMRPQPGPRDPLQVVADRGVELVEVQLRPVIDAHTHRAFAGR